jgi:hypothetical protein
MTPSESRLLKLRTEIIALPLGTPGQGYPGDVGPKDVGAIKDVQRLAPMAQPGRSDCPAASGPVR